MTHEYDGPFNANDIEAAVTKVIELMSAAPSTPLSVHIEQAVHQCICACAVDIEDEVEARRSGLHEALTQHVTLQVKQQITASRPPDEGSVPILFQPRHNRNE